MPIIQANESEYRNVDRISTGIPELDEKTGGGIPRKFTTELSGEPGTGKSALAMFIVKEAQDLGLRVLYADVERTFAYSFAEKIGIDLKKLNMLIEDTAEQYMNTILDMLDKKKVDLVILDSFGALEAAEDYERREVAAKGYPVLALLTDRFVRKAVIALPKANAALIVINHEKKTFEGFKKLLGGKSLAFHKTLALKLYHNGNNVKQGDEILGKEVMIKIEKIKANLGGTPWTEVKIHYTTEKGFTYVMNLIERGEAAGILTKKANTYYFMGETKIGTKNKVKDWLAIESNKIWYEQELTFALENGIPENNNS